MTTTTQVKTYGVILRCAWDDGLAVRSLVDGGVLDLCSAHERSVYASLLQLDNQRDSETHTHVLYLNEVFGLRPAFSCAWDHSTHQLMIAESTIQRKIG